MRFQRDAGGHLLILGKRAVQNMPDRLEYRNHIFEVGDSKLAVCLMLPTKTLWTYAKKKLREAGFIIRQDGDTEGTATFNRTNDAQTRLAIRMVGARPKRRQSPRQLANLRKPSERKADLAPGTMQTVEMGFGSTARSRADRQEQSDHEFAYALGPGDRPGVQQTPSKS